MMTTVSWNLVILETYDPKEGIEERKEEEKLWWWKKKTKEGGGE